MAIALDGLASHRRVYPWKPSGPAVVSKAMSNHRTPKSRGMIQAPCRAPASWSARAAAPLSGARAGFKRFGRVDRKNRLRTSARVFPPRLDDFGLSPAIGKAPEHRRTPGRCRDNSATRSHGNRVIGDTEGTDVCRWFGNPWVPCASSNPFALDAHERIHINCAAPGSFERLYYTLPSGRNATTLGRDGDPQKPIAARFTTMKKNFRFLPGCILCALLLTTGCVTSRYPHLPTTNPAPITAQVPETRLP